MNNANDPPRRALCPACADFPPRLGDPTAICRMCGRARAAEVFPGASGGTGWGVTTPAEGAKEVAFNNLLAIFLGVGGLIVMALIATSGRTWTGMLHK